MTKAEQFLWIVQTTMINNAINLSLDREAAIQLRDVFSATGTLGMCGDAIWASTRIPEDMDAQEAAVDFCTYMLRNLRQIEEKAHCEPLTVPDWFARS